MLYKTFIIKNVSGHMPIFSYKNSFQLFLLCVVNIYLSFTSHYFTYKKCVFKAEGGHVTRNVLNNKCFLKHFLLYYL